MTPQEALYRSESELPIFAKWFDFVNWLFPFADRLPKKVRFSVTNRIINLSLDLIDDLIEARYSRNKVTALRRANFRLEKLRILLRLCFEQRWISHKTFSHAVRSISEVGKMLGGWMKQQQGAIK